jgi:sporulation protein YtfJ
VIIPISQVACGFAAGGGEYETIASSKSQGMPFGGGSGAGVSVKPVGFLVVRMNDVRLISVGGNQLAERVVDIIPQVLDKLDNMKSKKNRPTEESGA